MRTLVTGAGGHLGSYLVDRVVGSGHELVAWGRVAGTTRGGAAIEAVDLEGADLEAGLERVSPEVILHLGAVSSAEAVRLDPGRARQVNVEATRRIAAWCRRRDRGLVFTSTDLVFAGTKAWNREDDPAEPVLAYGRTKREAEPAVLEVGRGLVVRVSLLYGPSRSGRPGFFDRTLAEIRRGNPQSLFEDEWRTPLDLATAAEALVSLATAGATGTIHLAGAERVSRHAMIARAAVALGLVATLVSPNRRGDVPLAEPRPADVSLDTTRLAALLPGLRRPSIEEVVRESGETIGAGLGY